MTNADLFFLALLNYSLIPQPLSPNPKESTHLLMRKYQLWSPLPLVCFIYFSGLSLRSLHLLPFCYCKQRTELSVGSWGLYSLSLIFPGPLAPNQGLWHLCSVRATRMKLNNKEKKKSLFQFLNFLAIFHFMCFLKVFCETSELQMMI